MLEGAAVVGAIHDPGLAVNLPCQLYIAEKFMFGQGKKKERNLYLCCCSLKKACPSTWPFTHTRIFHDALQ